MKNVFEIAHTVNERNGTVTVKCYECDQSGEQKRKVPCSHCGGSKMATYCYTCGDLMPCKGRPLVMGGPDDDPQPCMRDGRSDKRTAKEIRRGLGVGLGPNGECPHLNRGSEHE